MNFSPNKTPSEIISEGTFGGTYFRDIYSGVTGKLYRNSWKEFYYDAGVNKYRVRCGTSLRFWENKGWINEQDPCGWFQWYCRYHLGRCISDDSRQIKRWLGIVNRFKGILVKMIKDKSTKFDDVSVSPKIRQVLLHWGYELVESECQ